MNATMAQMPNPFPKRLRKSNSPENTTMVRKNCCGAVLVSSNDMTPKSCRQPVLAGRGSKMEEPEKLKKPSRPGNTDHQREVVRERRVAREDEAEGLPSAWLTGERTAPMRTSGMASMFAKRSRPDIVS